MLATHKISLGKPRLEQLGILDAEIEKFHGVIIDEDSDDAEAIDSLEFETKDDLDAFKLHWTLYGK